MSFHIASKVQLFVCNVMALKTAEPLTDWMMSQLIHLQVQFLRQLSSNSVESCIGGVNCFAAILHSLMSKDGEKRSDSPHLATQDQL